MFISHIFYYLVLYVFISEEKKKDLPSDQLFTFIFSFRDLLTLDPITDVSQINSEISMFRFPLKEAIIFNPYILS